MKIPLFSVVFALILFSALPNFSQTSDSTTVGKNETVSFLIQQNENARTLISSQEKRIADLENELMTERENSGSLVKSYDAAKSEIVNLKSSNEALSRAVAINESTIAVLKDDNAKQREKAKKANRDKWKAILVAAGVVAIKLALP